MGVVVDDAGHQAQAPGIDALSRRAEVAADGGDAPVGNGEIAVYRRGAQSVVDAGVRDEEVVHALVLVVVEGERVS